MKRTAGGARAGSGPANFSDDTRWTLASLTRPQATSMSPVTRSRRTSRTRSKTFPPVHSLFGRQRDQRTFSELPDKAGRTGAPLGW